MLTYHPISELNIKIYERTHGIDNKTTNQIQEIWDDSQNKARLFNRQILSVSNINGYTIDAFPVDYKEYFAQKNSDDLYLKLHVRPLAVSGILECPEGIIFGLRGETTQDKHKWELIPSGSIDYTESKLYSSSNLHINQITTELNEEVGITKKNIQSIRTCAIIDDQVTHVVDIGIYLKTNLPFADIFNIYKQNGCNEYSDILAIPTHNITNFIEINPVVSVSKILIQHVINY